MPITVHQFFRENKTKFDLVWNDDETILRYNESCNYIYDEELSNGSNPKKLNITTVNLPLMVSYVYM